ncbi:hypothetical protein HUT18_02565 [Streptomyces sp. NA04227]|uniref:hypothetical protein n=1 Tax=Streptomyces sp. NA04227 TaxID=2742136 RepID=UPI0015908848|nr:hypothetical protein [Streptomyces sp. NA04227]QKW05424.1 hypothetical protein HUT18_02565 [Streptomyces sp. NA04227]
MRTGQGAAGRARPTAGGSTPGRPRPTPHTSAEPGTEASVTKPGTEAAVTGTAPEAAESSSKENQW